MENICFLKAFFVSLELLQGSEILKSYENAQGQFWTMFSSSCDKLWLIRPIIVNTQEKQGSSKIFMIVYSLVPINSHASSTPWERTASFASLFLIDIDTIYMVL